MKEDYYTTTLKNVVITKVATVSPAVLKSAVGKQERMSLTMTYKEVSWAFKDGTKSAMDNWEAKE